MPVGCVRRGRLSLREIDLVNPASPDPPPVGLAKHNLPALASAPAQRIGTRPSIEGLDTPTQRAEASSKCSIQPPTHQARWDCGTRPRHRQMCSRGPLNHPPTPPWPLGRLGRPRPYRVRIIFGYVWRVGSPYRCPPLVWLVECLAARRARPDRPRPGLIGDRSSGLC